MYSTEPLAHVVDEYRDCLHESLPTATSGDGVHAHDDRIEDLSRSAIEGHGRDLSGFSRRLDRISTRSLTAEEQLERRMLADQIRGRLFELEDVRPWERNPQHYGELLATSLAGQTLFEYAPLEERARRVRLFREHAYLEEGSARREAERGTFDPGYVLYAARRLMLLKLRDDLQAREGSKFSLKSFHDRLLGQGSLPLWLHRMLRLGDTGDELLD